MKKSKYKLPVGNIKSENTLPKEKIEATNDGQNNKVDKFSKIMAFQRDQAWQFWGFFLTLILTLCTATGLIVNLFNEKKLDPLSIPNNFVAYSNPDFALSLPYTVNQNKSFSSRTYGFNLEESGNETKFLQIMVMEGKDIQPDQNAFTDEGIAESKEAMSKVISQLGGSAFKVNLLSHEADSFQGNKGQVMVWEGYGIDEETQESVYAKFKMRFFFNEKTKRLYQIVYTPDQKTETILSTINLSKVE